MPDGSGAWKGYDDLVLSLCLQALVVDKDFRIRLITPAAAALLRADCFAMGQHVNTACGSATRFDLKADIRLVLAKGGDVRRAVVIDPDRRMTRRCLPYKSTGEVLGVIVLFEMADMASVIWPGAMIDPDDMSGSGSRQLTARQCEIMDLVVAGHPTKRIAAYLGISTRTVENHRSNIMRRTGCRSLPELTRFALKAVRSASDRSTCGDGPPAY